MVKGRSRALDEVMNAHGALVTVGVGPLSGEDLLAVARDGAGVRVGDDAVAAMAQARGGVEELADQ